MLQQNSCGNTAMPLLIGFTPKTPIIENSISECFTYDENAQIAEYNMMAVGTKSLKVTTTAKNKEKNYSHTDKKNEIDDKK